MEPRRTRFRHDEKAGSSLLHLQVVDKSTNRYHNVGVVSRHWSSERGTSRVNWDAQLYGGITTSHSTRREAKATLVERLRLRDAEMGGGHGWIGVDFDGTLARYHGNYPKMGEPIAAMMLRVQRWVSLGIDVRIFTARACDPEQIPLVQDWCERYGLPRLPVTNVKDFAMFQLWDDRAVSVGRNNGQILTRSYEIHKGER
jgi:hypothetical protein